jgi:dihydroorotase
VVDEKVLELGELIHRLTAGPAAILGLAQGTLAVEAAADICIFNPETTWRLDPTTMQSNAHNTPFLGREMKGRVMHTLLDGSPVYSLS